MSSPTPIPAPRQRDPYFDNVRGFLIILVVVGHLLSTVRSGSSGAVVAWIYAFHMPAFVAVTGYLSRGWSATPQQCRALVMTLAVPFVVFQTMHALLATLLRDKPFSVQFIDPAWTLWFLLAVIFWRVLTPVMRALRFPLILALVLSVTAPLDAELDQRLSLARVLGFMPFYVLGVVTTPERVARLRAALRPWMGWTVLAAAFAMAAATHHRFSTRLFFLDSAYEGDSPVRSMIVRVLVLGAGLVGLLAVLAISSGRRTWLTSIGQNTLHVYLVHALLLWPVRNTERLQAMDTVWHTAALVVAGTALAWVLSRRPVVSVVQHLVNPPGLDRVLLRAAPPTPLGAAPAPSSAGTAPAGSSAPSPDAPVRADGDGSARRD